MAQGKRKRRTSSIPLAAIPRPEKRKSWTPKEGISARQAVKIIRAVLELTQ